MTNASSYTDILPFELVDIAVDYGRHIDNLHVWEVGSKQNKKISTLLCSTVDMLKRCGEETEGGKTKELNSSHLFKMCLKRLIKKLCKLILNNTEITGQVIF